MDWIRALTFLVSIAFVVAFLAQKLWKPTLLPLCRVLYGLSFLTGVVHLIRDWDKLDPLLNFASFGIHVAVFVVVARLLWPRTRDTATS